MQLVYLVVCVWRCRLRIAEFLLLLLMMSAEGSHSRFQLTKDASGVGQQAKRYWGSSAGTRLRGRQGWTPPLTTLLTLVLSFFVRPCPLDKTSGPITCHCHYHLHQSLTRHEALQTRMVFRGEFRGIVVPTRQDTPRYRHKWTKYMSQRSVTCLQCVSEVLKARQCPYRQLYSE